MKNRLLKLTLMLALILINPINTFAKESICIYEFNNTKLEYKINNNNLILPFEDNEFKTAVPWFHEEKFKEKYLKSTKTSNSKFTCPTLMIEESEQFTTIFVNGTKRCNGTCTMVNSVSSEIKVNKTILGNAIGNYQKETYFIPVFRSLSDGTVEYSINDKDFYAITKTVNISKNENIKIDY